MDAFKSPLRSLQSAWELMESSSKDGTIVYHVGGGDFNEFLLDKVGSGAGGAVFGYGIYFSDSSEEVVQYAKELTRQGKPSVFYKVLISGNFWLYNREVPDDFAKRVYSSQGIDIESLWSSPVEIVSENLHVMSLDAVWRSESGNLHEDFPSEWLDMYGEVDMWSVPLEYQKASSKLLKSLGIDGFEVVGESEESGATIYCIWNSESLEIESKKRL